MSDLIERARCAENDQTCCGVDAGRSGPCNNEYLIGELADEIERLQFALGVCETNRHADAEYCAHLESQIKRMKPVIDAALRWQKAWQHHCNTLPNNRFEDSRYCYELAEALDRSKEQ